MKIPRIVIAGTHSGVGKTTIATGIMAKLAEKGFNLQPFKVGPDFIDPSYHTVATGNFSRNLDTWMLGSERIKELFYTSASRADISIIEGVMGLFDGFGGTDESGSTAHVAKTLQAPVILIMDASSMARSAAALALGYRDLDPEVNIAGIILNRVGSDRHYNIVKDAIEHYTGIPILGFLNKNINLTLPERHLGLVPTGENSELRYKIKELGKSVTENINLDLLIKIAADAEIFREPENNLFELADKMKNNGERKVRIGIASDEAFSFYYRDGLDVLETMGAELVPFSPLHDPQLPKDLDGLFIGGGFPELFLDILSDNKTLIQSIKKVSLEGMPIYAECGGFMYLTESVTDFKGYTYRLVGLIPGSCIMENKRVGLGYVTAKALKNTLIADMGEEFRGHEFHYSRLEPKENFEWALSLTRTKHNPSGPDGYAKANLMASYVHVNFAGCPRQAEKLIEACREFKRKKYKSSV